MMKINKPAAQQNKTNPKGALDRIADLENTIPSIIQATNNGLQSLSKNMADLDEIVQSIADVVGMPLVQAAIDRRKAEREAAAAEEGRRQIELLLGEGKIRLVDKVTENSLLVGVEYDKEGKAVGAGRVQIAYRTLLPAFKEKALGQAPGLKFETPIGSTLEVLEIYEPVEQPAPPADTDAAPATPAAAESTESVQDVPAAAPAAEG